MKIAIILCFFGWSFAFAATPIRPATWNTPDQQWATRRPVTAQDERIISAYRSSQKLTYKANFKNGDIFRKEWRSVKDDRPNLKACRRAANVQMSPDGLRLKTLSAPSDCKTKWSTGFAVSNFKQKYGFFEARIKIADLAGMNNAFWLATADEFEINVTEYRLPNNDNISLNNWAKSVKDNTVGMQVQFKENFSKGFHDFGVLWTPAELIFEVDGHPVGVLQTRDAIHEPAEMSFTAALTELTGKPSENLVGHDMVIESIRVSALSDLK